RTQDYAVARCAGLFKSLISYPGLADSLWATRCRPLRGLVQSLISYPGLADSPWATRRRPLRGLVQSLISYPGLADSPWATRCRPLRGLVSLRSCIVVALHTQGSRTRPGLHAVARCAGLFSR